MMHLDEMALEAAVLAHDKEEAAMRGEPDPWADERPENEFADRKAAMALAIRAYLTALTPADVGGLVDTLRSMSHDDNTRACVSVNITGSNDLAKKLFDVLHAAPKAATALEAQAAELAVVHQRYVDADEARIDAEAQLAEARKALDLFEHYGCPICHGDCSSANPPVDCCPMEAARRVREGGKVE